ncbi:MAG: ABC transporter permease, partial [Kiritimatiellaeota bacterium]|nr:ABC transporter permease [Kiritimatiellota bacterium]
MTRFQLVLRSLWYYRRLNLAAAAGMFLGAAVITGALCVGDSLRGTLRDLAVRRLGRIAFVLEDRDLFRQELAKALGASKRWPVSAVGPPAAILRTAGTARRAAGGELGVPARAVVLGIGPEFWKIFGSGFGTAVGPALDGRSAAVSKTLADALGAGVGDAVVVTVGKEAAAPALSLFAHRKQDTTQISFRVVIRAVLTGGPAFFSLRHDQYGPPNLFVDRAWLGRQVRAEGKANILLAAQAPGAEADAPATDSALAAAFAESATLADYGFRLSAPDPGARCRLDNRRLVLPGPAVRLVDRAASRSNARVMLTSFFLANSIEKVGDKAGADASGRTVPYSVLGALASFPPLDPVAFEDGSRWNAPLEPDEIVLNAWTARELRAGPGDRIRLRYFAMRDDGGLDAGTAVLRLRAVLPMTSPLQTSALVPQYRGITDAETLADWDPPFPVDLRRIRPADEAYWRRYRTTPKAFVSAAFMRNLWQPRSPGTRERPGGPAADWITTAVLDFGNAPNAVTARERFVGAFLDELNRSALQLQFRPVRREALAAAHGSSDFGGLFLGMSMFLIGAAALFAGLAVRLNATRRARETGLLLAVGWQAKTVRRLLLIEAATLALVSGILGLPAGVGYARMLIWGVNTRWRSIVGELPALQLHAVPVTLAGGAAAGILAGVLAAAWGGRALTRRRPILLLGG